MSQFFSDSIFWVDIGKVFPNPYQPRKEFDEAKFLIRLRTPTMSSMAHTLLQALFLGDLQRRVLNRRD